MSRWMALGARVRAVDRSWVARWVAAPALAGLLLAARVDPATLPIVGREELSAVLLLDGQAYFGRLTDNALSDSLELRDVYYFQDARASSMNQSVGLVRRGTEVHQPADGMTLRRDKVLAIEAVGSGSQVSGAIATDRTLREPVLR